MEHKYYPKINETIAASESMGALWVATEKIHGAQFVIGSDGKSVKFGKRKAWLADDEPFFGWQLLRNQLTESALKVFSIMGTIQSVYLYGEIFGGNYPHKEVENNSALSAIQTGVWYSPDIHFALFDILVVGKGFTDEVFLAFTEVKKIATDTNLFVVPKLGIGTFNKLMQLPVRYESKVAPLLNLPAIKNNYAEGFVLKPDIKIAASKRAIIKVKIPEFKENRFDESQAFNPNTMPGIDELIALCEKMINPVRVASAKSKVGDDKKAIIEEAVLDVMVDLESIFPLKMQSLTEEEEEKITAHIKLQISPYLYE
ncbi:MAG: RNA ligase family protein [Bacteroidales bacterium]|nr:RNA ligase family protein [Bacteroidales bacterium]